MCTEKFYCFCFLFMEAFFHHGINNNNNNKGHLDFFPHNCEIQTQNYEMGIKLN